MSIKNTIIAGMVILTLGMLNACSTVNGFGKDMSQAGKEIQRASRQ